MKNKILYLVLASLLLAFSCQKKKPTGIVHIQQSDKQEREDPYVQWNQASVEREEEDIDFFLQRYGWQMEETGTGLRFCSVKEGAGDFPHTEDVVTLRYATILLTGDTIYSSDRDGLKKFKVDKTDEMQGLNEAVKKMRKGGKARLIIPSFLGYGVAGDGNRVRGKMSLAMYIELVDIQRNSD